MKLSILAVEIYGMLVPIKKSKLKFTSDASAVGSKVEPRLRGIYVDSDDGANDNSEWIFLFVISA